MFASNNSQVTIDSLTAVETGPIWAVNSSSKSNPPGADVYITVHVGKQGSPAILTLPLSWVPFNLNEQAPRQAILESQHFLKAVSSGSITLVTAEEAESLRQRPSYAKEVERLRQLQDAVKNATQNSGNNFTLTLDDKTESVGIQQQKAKTSLGLSDADFAPDAEEVSVSFKAWSNKLNTLGVDEAIAALQLRGTFSNEELIHIRDTTKHDRIRAGMTKKINELTSSGE